MTGDDQFFWDGLERGELLLSECAGCGRLQQPPSPMCSQCGSVSWRRRRATGRGTVHSWIVSHHPNRPDEPARVVGLIDLEEGVRLVSNIVDCAPADVRNEMDVEVVYLDVDGTRLPQFRPVRP